MKEGVETTEPSQEEERFFADDELDMLDDGIDPEPDTEEQEPEEEKPADKFAGKTPEEILEAYKNLEAMMGKQAQELGELRKRVDKPDSGEPPPEGKAPTFADILNGSDTDLDAAIARYEEYLATPNMQIDESENYGLYNVQYAKLLNERSIRNIGKKAEAKAAVETNVNIANQYKNGKNLSEAEITKLKEYAEKRLSDDGRITEADLDVAMHKLYPDKWQRASIEKVKKQVAEAKTKATPRLSGGTTSTATIVKTVEEVLSMDEDDMDSYLDTLSADDLAELRTKINKKG